MSLKALIVEDDELLLETLEKGFRHEGFEVDIAKDGFQALQKAKTNSYDIIILDVVIPKIDGVKVCKQLRLQSEIPIIMLTAKSQLEDKLEGLEAGADDYITKPFSFKELIMRVKTVLRRYNKVQEEKIVLKDLTMDLKDFKVFYKEKAINLTPKEFELLKVLAQNPNKTIRREVLLNKVWGIASYYDSNIVDVYIKNIRNKLEDKPPKLILTIRGRGYMLSTEQRE